MLVVTLSLTAAIGNTPEQAEQNFRCTYHKQISNYQTEETKAMLKVLLIDPNEENTFSIREIENELKPLQELVKGNIECLTLVHSQLHDNNLSAFVNEEGLFYFSDPNYAATHICQVLKRIPMQQAIFGPMVITGPVGDEGETTSITQEALDLLNEIACFKELSKLKV